MRILKNIPVIAGASLILAVTILAVAGPFFVPDPYAMSGPAFAPPSLEYPMGTDDLGRNVFSRFVTGARVSLGVGFLAAIAAAMIGVIVGAVSGYFLGPLDQILMRVTEFFQVIPSFFLALLLVALFGSNYGVIIFAIAILGWPPIARLARAEFLSLRERDFVVSMNAIGVGHGTLIFREILPNAAPALVIMTTLQVSSAILIEASLSFIGLGDPSLPSWGAMLNESQQMIRDAWWMAVFPGAGIFVTVAALNVLGDGINDLLNPRNARS